MDEIWLEKLNSLEKECDLKFQSVIREFEAKLQAVDKERIARDMSSNGSTKLMFNAVDERFNTFVAYNTEFKENLGIRLDEMNHVKAQVKEYAATMMTREQVEAAIAYAQTNSEKRMSSLQTIFGITITLCIAVLAAVIELYRLKP